MDCEAGGKKDRVEAGTREMVSVRFDRPSGAVPFAPLGGDSLANGFCDSSKGVDGCDEEGIVDEVEGGDRVVPKAGDEAVEKGL